MESVVTAVITGALTSVSCLVSNSRSQAVNEVKTAQLSEKVQRYYSMIERTNAMERDVAVLKHEIEAMGRVT